MKFFKKNKMQSNKEVTDTNEPTPQDELLNSTEEQNVEEQQNTEENPADLLKEELAIANDKYIRLYSDFENYKKRMMRERVDLIKTAGADAAVFADMLGRLAEDARYYAERADENYRAGVTCERIYDSVRQSNNMMQAEITSDQ